mmetsp:Transcript_16825/g.23260  ORF Transcript_16825/g.23260 Transcript_16825/m.23260 type:complete len:235 (-) Transcript_16825:674-1378(-)
MTLVAPSVSIQSNFFTSTFFFAIFSAVSVSKDVTVDGRPCGTLATITRRKPVMNMKSQSSPFLRATPITKKRSAMDKAKAAIKYTNRVISRSKLLLMLCVVVVNFATDPTTVLSPVAITSPIPFPSNTSELLNPRHLDSVLRIAKSSSASLERETGSDSPVNAAHSTLSSVQCRIRMSAGIFCPGFKTTMSPTTSSSALMTLLSLSRKTVASEGSMLEKESITARAFRSCLKER